MPAARTETAVAFTVREKFSWTLASLQRLYALAGAPFTLYIVDGYYPPQVQAELAAFLAGKDNVVRITAERYLYPSEALNAVIERMAEPYLFQLQNDVLIGRNALGSMLATAKKLGCEVVAPVILDTDSGVPAIHREGDKPVAIVEEAGRVYVARLAPPALREGHRRTYYFEMHCLLMKAETARALRPLPPLSVHEHIDLGVALWRMGGAAYEDKNARVLFMDTPPVRLRDFECPYFRFRWDVVRARLSDQYVRTKWRIVDLFDPGYFIGRQLTALQPGAVLTRYGSALETDAWPEEIAAA